jgi:hypothetical protein
LVHPRILSRTKSNTRHGQHQNSGLDTIAFQSNRLLSILQPISTRSIFLIIPSPFDLSTSRFYKDPPPLIQEILYAFVIFPIFPILDTHKIGQSIIWTIVEICVRLTTKFILKFKTQFLQATKQSVREQREHPPAVGFDVKAEGW